MPRRLLGARFAIQVWNTHVGSSRPYWHTYFIVEPQASTAFGDESISDLLGGLIDALGTFNGHKWRAVRIS